MNAPVGDLGDAVDGMIAGMADDVCAVDICAGAADPSTDDLNRSNSFLIWTSFKSDDAGGSARGTDDFIRFNSVLIWEISSSSADRLGVTVGVAADGEPNEAADCEPNDAGADDDSGVVVYDGGLNGAGVDDASATGADAAAGGV